MIPNNYPKLPDTDELINEIVKRAGDGIAVQTAIKKICHDFEQNNNKTAYCNFLVLAKLCGEYDKIKFNSPFHRAIFSNFYYIAITTMLLEAKSEKAQSVLKDFLFESDTVNNLLKASERMAALLGDTQQDPYAAWRILVEFAPVQTLPRAKNWITLFLDYYEHYTDDPTRNFADFVKVFVYDESKQSNNPLSELIEALKDCQEEELATGILDQLFSQCLKQPSLKLMHFLSIKMSLLLDYLQTSTSKLSREERNECLSAILEQNTDEKER